MGRFIYSIPLKLTKLIITSTWKVPYLPLLYCILSKIMFNYLKYKITASINLWNHSLYQPMKSQPLSTNEITAINLWNHSHYQPMKSQPISPYEITASINLWNHSNFMAKANYVDKCTQQKLWLLLLVYIKYVDPYRLSWFDSCACRRL